MKPEINIENLTRARNYIRDHVPASAIEMSLYRIGDESDPECGSTGCIIGHTTILDKDNVLEHYQTRGATRKIDFYVWSLGFYFNAKSCNLATNQEQVWEYLFSGHWPNNKAAAIRRMNYVIKNGDAPECDTE